MTPVRLPQAFGWFLHAVSGSRLPVMKLKPVAYCRQAADSTNKFRQKGSWDTHFWIRLDLCKTDSEGSKEMSSYHKHDDHHINIKPNEHLHWNTTPWKRTRFGTCPTAKRPTLSQKQTSESPARQHFKSLETMTSCTNRKLHVPSFFVCFNLKILC